MYVHVGGAVGGVAFRFSALRIMTLALPCASLVVALLLCWNPPSVHATHVKGSLVYRQSERPKFVFFLSRFGVSKGHDMYTYGTIYRNNDDLIGFHGQMTLVLIPQVVWDDFYNVSHHYSDDYYAKCDAVMQASLNDSILISDDRCPARGTEDYLRSVPCDYDDGNYTQCNQPQSLLVVDGQNFTFRITAAPSTSYYYLFLMTCTRNASVNCGWASTDVLSISYDIRLVNNRPQLSNSYTNEFPYDLQGTLTLQIVFTLLYLSLISVHFLLHSRLCVKKGNYRIHVLVKVFSLSLVLESLYVLLELFHSSAYAANGKGVVAFKYLGEVANQFSDWLLILVVILVGKGWQVTTSSLRWSKVTVGIWGAYIFFSAIYFVWTVVSKLVVLDTETNRNYRL